MRAASGIARASNVIRLRRCVAACLNEIVLGERGITADTALRLARLLKTSPQF